MLGSSPCRCFPKLKTSSVTLSHCHACHAKSCRKPRILSLKKKYLCLEKKLFSPRKIYFLTVEYFQASSPPNLDYFAKNNNNSICVNQLMMYLCENFFQLCSQIQLT